MKLIIITLLQCLAITNSLSYYNSDVFISAANSNAFKNSESITHFNSYLSYVYTLSTSQRHKSILPYSNHKTSYISFVVSNNPVSTTLYSLSTQKPTKSPTISPTISPSQNPTKSPTIGPSISPSQKPTLIPTQAPLNECQVLIAPPIFTFGTNIAFSNMTSMELDNESQKAIVLATADSMIINAIFVKYIETVETRRRLLTIMIISLQTTIPLQGYFDSYQSNPSELYSTLTTNLANSVNTGAFIKALPPIFANSTVTSIENSNYVIILPPIDTQHESKKKVDLSIVYIVIFLLALLLTIKIAYDFPKIKKRCTATDETNRI
jgi:hypothetical protein